MFLRLLFAGGSGLVPDLGMDTEYSATQSSALAECIITVKTDGTWTVTVGAGDSAGGTPTSGNWASSPAAGVGSGFELKYTASGGVGSPTITNDASSYTTISSNLTFKVEKNNADASSNVLVEIRNLSNGASVSESTNLAANGAL